MQRIWKQLNLHIDILLMAVTSLVVAGGAWANINSTLAAHEKQLAVHSFQIQQVQGDTQTIKETAARTEQKVDDMAVNITEIKQWLRSSK